MVTPPSFERVVTRPVVPLATCVTADESVGLVETLAAAGLPLLELTLRASGAIEALEAAAGRADFCLGAGTVLTPDQAERAIDAGAQFVVSPGFDEAIVTRCLDRGVLPIPGVATGTELMRATSLGLRLVKIFPAEAIGGAGLIRALAGPFPEVRFMPTGGVSPKNLAEYLSTPGVVACGGSWLAPRESVERLDWPSIAERVRSANEIAQRCG